MSGREKTIEGVLRGVKEGTHEGFVHFINDISINRQITSQNLEVTAIKLTELRHNRHINRSSLDLCCLVSPLFHNPQIVVA